MKYPSFVLGALLFVSYATADVVVLKNGDRLTGTVDSVSGGQVLLTTEYAGHVSIKQDSIAELVTKEKFIITTAADKVEGVFAMQDGEQVLKSGEAGQPLSLASVHTAKQDKLSLTTLARQWSTRADLAADVSNGNTDTEKYSTLVESRYKRGLVEHSLSLRTASEKAEDETTKDEMDLDYGYKRFLTKKWYASSTGEYFEDRIKDVDSRISASLGMGYQFWDNSLGQFSSDLGLTYVREDLDGEIETNPAVRWGLEYRRFLLAKKLEAFHKQSVLFIPDADRGEVLESSSGLRYALNSRIDATARVDVDHETKPVDGKGKTDVTYNVGIGIKF